MKNSTKRALLLGLGIGALYQATHNIWMVIAIGAFGGALIIEMEGIIEDALNNRNV